jgi:hypothetical protein
MAAAEFRPRKYDVTKAQLEAWRAAGESTWTIATRFKNCSASTVYRWLVRLGLPTMIQESPSQEDPGKQPVTKRVVFEAERAARNALNATNATPSANDLDPQTA